MLIYTGRMTYNYPFAEDDANKTSSTPTTMMRSDLIIHSTTALKYKIDDENRDEDDNAKQIASAHLVRRHKTNVSISFAGAGGILRKPQSRVASCDCI